jgi:hypothetical protein
MPAASTPTAVPCLAGLYAALGAGEEPVAAAVPAHRRVLAVAAAGMLALGMASWPAGAPARVLGEAPAGADRPAATLPEWPDLLPDDDAG